MSQRGHLFAAISIAWIATVACEESSAELPERLSAQKVKAGLDALDTKTKTCGTKHGAEAGTTVNVRLTIVGATGGVSEAWAQAPHAETPLGDCVASALQQATFPKFAAESIGVSYCAHL